MCGKEEMSLIFSCTAFDLSLRDHEIIHHYSEVIVSDMQIILLLA